MYIYVVYSYIYIDKEREREGRRYVLCFKKSGLELSII